MDRRAFFRRGLQKVTQTAVETVEQRVERRAAHWIRPPFALRELDFLTTCTRCRACIEACPHAVIFPLSARLGATVAATPALDLLNRGCHLCADWPCVDACEHGALKLPARDGDRGDGDATAPGPTPPARLARARLDPQRCLPFQGPECGACEGSCPVPGALTFRLARPAIDASLCTGCGLCREACIVEPKAIGIASLASAAAVS